MAKAALCQELFERGWRLYGVRRPLRGASRSFPFDKLRVRMTILCGMTKLMREMTTSLRRMGG